MFELLAQETLTPGDAVALPGVPPVFMTTFCAGSGPRFLNVALMVTYPP
jgi:hypothetical protein